MKMQNTQKRMLVTLLMMILGFSTALCQSTTLQGTVYDVTGLSLPGATVQLKGTALGAVTDENGGFSLKMNTLPSQMVVIVSSVGYMTKEVKFKPGQTLKVVLEEEIQKLDEVVVTALGISRETKSLGYSVSQMDGKTVEESRENNLLNSLSNKIAGVQITNSSGAIGASSNIQIRGQNFVSGYNYNNSPLFVVDGIPVSNNNEQSTKAFTGRQDFNNPNFTSGEGEVDFGNAAGEINPADIESISVLKGPNAAALYGARAANGVILITTKNGLNQKNLGITVSSTSGFDTPLRLPKFQNVYGQGKNGEYAYQNGLGGGVNDNVAENWGPRMDGQLVAQFDSPLDKDGNPVPTPFVAQPDQLKDFFQLGQNYTNTITISNSNNKLNYRFSYTNTYQVGIVPNTDLKKNAIGLNTGYQILPNLRVDVGINYLNTKSDNRTSGGAKNDDNIMRIFLYMPRNVSLDALKQDWKNDRQNTPFGGETSTGLNNPYFVVRNNLNGNNRNRVFGNVKVSYNITDHLALMIRTGRDVYSDKRTMRHANTSKQYFNGYYQEDDVSFTEMNHDFLLTYTLPQFGKVGLNVSAGGSMMIQRSERLGAIAGQLAIPNVFNLTNNAVPIIAGNNITEKKVNSLYFTAQLNYRNSIFLDITGRNDWSSALPKNNNSYFYPSAALSAVLTDLFNIKSDVLTFAKLRAGTSLVRRDLEPYQTSTNFVVSQGWGGNTVASANNNYPNPDIRPEQVFSYEGGLEVQLFKKRIGFDLTLYKSETTDLIIPVTLNPSAAYDTKLMNVGKMTNRGIELLVNFTPVRVRNFSWDASFNFASNKNKVVRLAEEIGVSRIRQLERWASLELRTVNTKGDGSFGSLYGDYLIYKNGSLTHKNGLPQEENGDWGYLGNINPKYTGGFENIFKYKDITLSCLWGFQKGGAVHSRTYIEGIKAGSLEESLRWREGEGNGNMVGEGIDVNSGGNNSTEVTVRDYTRAYYDNDRIATFDASYIKLREVKLGYSLPKYWLKRTPLKDVSVSLYGRNLLLFTKVPHIDPEVSSYDGKLQGVESMALPSTRNFGINLNVRL